MNEIRTVQVTRYATPLREGGSLPAIVAADDGFMYVLKFRGSGQGIKSLIAEFIGGEIARLIGLKVPEIVFAGLDEAFGRSEPDEEIQDLLKASRGLNIALHYLSGSVTYEPSVVAVDALTASKIVWLDAYIANVDRTAKNTNMLFWNHELWLIDHGASMFYHHSWPTFLSNANKPFALIKEQVLLHRATALPQADADIRKILTPAKIDEVIDALPTEWLEAVEEADAQEVKDAYRNFLKERLSNDHFLKPAMHER